MPVLSIIIPSYNADDTINSAIKDILNQTHKDFELIIVDDGSRNEVESVIKDLFTDRRIRCFRQQNKGGSAAMNHGLRQAKGKYVLFLDADDRFDNTFLEKLINNCIEYDTDMTVCGHRIHNVSDNIVVNALPVDYKKQLGKVVFSAKDIQEAGGNPFRALNAFYFLRILKKDFLIKNNLYFNENLRYFKDVDFSNRANILANKISYVDEVLMTYKRTKEAKERYLTNYLSCMTAMEGLVNFLVNNPKLMRFKNELFVYAIEKMSVFFEVISDKEQDEIYNRLLNIKKKLLIDKSLFENVTIKTGVELVKLLIYDK